MMIQMLSKSESQTSPELPNICFQESALKNWARKTNQWISIVHVLHFEYSCTYDLNISWLFYSPCFNALILKPYKTATLVWMFPINSQNVHLFALFGKQPFKEIQYKIKWFICIVWQTTIQRDSVLFLQSLIFFLDYHISSSRHLQIKFKIWMANY